MVGVEWGRGLGGRGKGRGIEERAFLPLPLPHPFAPATWAKYIFATLLIERRIVTSCYHGSRISGSQQEGV